MPSRAEPRVLVGCATCHRGLALPKSLQTTLFEIAQKDGAEAAVARYRALRQNTLVAGKSAEIDFTLGELHRGRNENERAVQRYRAALEKPATSSCETMAGRADQAMIATLKTIIAVLLLTTTVAAQGDVQARMQAWSQALGVSARIAMSEGTWTEVCSGLSAG